MLDKSQTVIANHYGSNLLVLAGAGSGKTATVTHRGARLIQAGLDPRRSLMMTFTNKAAKEMKARMIDLFILNKMNNDLPNITTYHQFGYRLVKKYHDLLGFEHGMPTIMTERDASSEWINAYLSVGGRLSKDLLKKSKLHKILPELIANQGIVLNLTSQETLNKMVAFIKKEPELADCADELLTAFYEYSEFKKTQNVLDFNDMISLPIQLLSTYESVRNSISGFLHDVVIDESQDNNQAQYELLKLITAQGHVPTMMIGDADQAIYEWRGANPSNLSRFLTEFNAQKFILERNYRSNSDIVAGAQSLVSNNVKRIEKHAFSERFRASMIQSESHCFKEKIGLSDSILYTKSNHVYDLGRQLAAHIKAQQARGGSLSEIAILYRSKRIGYFIDKVLSENGILTNMITGTGLMERMESLLTIAALRLKVNPFDHHAYKRLALTLPGYGEKSIQSVLDQSKEKKIPLNSQKFTDLKPAIVSNHNRLMAMIATLERPDEIHAWMKANFSDYLMQEAKAKIKQDVKAGNLPDKTLSNPDLLEAKSAAIVLNYLGNIEVIENSIKLQIEQEDYQDSIWEVITDLSLDAPHSKKDKQGVQLSTIHSYKGLEAKEVHVAGFSDGLMPLKDNEGIIDNSEEERRLAYVAITRAKDNLFLHHLKNYDVITGGVGSNALRRGETIYLKEIIDEFSMEKEMN